VSLGHGVSRLGLNDYPFTIKVSVQRWLVVLKNCQAVKLLLATPSVQTVTHATQQVLVRVTPIRQKKKLLYGLFMFFKEYNKACNETQSQDQFCMAPVVSENYRLG